MTDPRTGRVSLKHDGTVKMANLPVSTQLNSTQLNWPRDLDGKT